MDASPATTGEPIDEPRTVRSQSKRLKDFIPIYIPGVKKGLINHGPRKRRFLDFLKAQPSKAALLRAGIQGRLSTFTYALRNSVRWRSGRRDPNAAAHDSGAATSGGKFRVPFVRNIKWKFFLDYFKNWIKHPMNMALFVWLIFVVAGIIALGLLMLGALNDAIPKSSQRKRWTEIVNQILNALFTIMCLYQHPKIGHHLVILCRWTQKDAVELRSAYSKTSASRRHERWHMAFVLILLHLTCFSQYMLCALYWGWTSKTRPDWPNYLCMGIGIAAPVIAGLYVVYSPLGRKTDPETQLIMGAMTDEESQKSSTLTTSGSTRRVRVVVTEPQWLGGLFDCWDDVTVAYLSFFCTFCVFGWNMERLGFGNMYVHIVTFVLLCLAPLLVFNVAALNINDDMLKYMVGISGCVLCFCGLLYGGFWRIQMRNKFKLPANRFCCGYGSVTDCFQWLFCWPCALAQEVRTGNYYEIEDDSFYRRSLEEEALAVLEPLPREGQAGPRNGPGFDSLHTTDIEEGQEEQIMNAPSPATIQPEKTQQ